MLTVTGSRPGTEPAREKPALTIHQVNDDQD
jgi:hypothetical protein